jgi:hypothetical protein
MICDATDAPQRSMIIATTAPIANQSVARPVVTISMTSMMTAMMSHIIHQLIISIILPI